MTLINLTYRWEEEIHARRRVSLFREAKRQHRLSNLTPTPNTNLLVDKNHDLYLNVKDGNYLADLKLRSGFNEKHQLSKQQIRDFEALLDKFLADGKFDKVEKYTKEAL